jgi:hypothetical protein
LVIGQLGGKRRGVDVRLGASSSSEKREDELMGDAINCSTSSCTVVSATERFRGGILAITASITLLSGDDRIGEIILGFLISFRISVTGLGVTVFGAPGLGNIFATSWFL